MERHRYTPKEWHYNNRLQQKSCYNQQILTDRIINESHKLKEETKEIVVQNRKQTDHYLNERIETIAFNRNEIQQQRQEICSQIDSLIVYTERLNDFIKSLQNLSIRCERCIEIRENRLGVDLVRDNVEKELLKEKKLIRDTLKILIATVERSDEQMRRLRSAKYFIDRDLNDKDNALRIDEQNSCLNETQSDLQLHYNTSIYKPSIITPDDWQQFSNDNIERGAKEVVTARQLCSHIDNLLIQTPRDLNEQSDCVNEVLRYRIEDLKLVKDKLEKQHAQIVRQITELKQTILDLEESIADKRGFMALAQTRLNNRGQRSGMEQCKDTVEASLINEIRSLYANITQLQQMLRENQSSLRQLLKSQIQLEDEMNLKMNSIKIDETDCMTLHQTLNTMNKTVIELKFNPLIPVLPTPTKFTLEEWQLNQQQTFRNSNSQQILADSILAESDRLRQQIGEITKDNRTDTDHLIEQKIKDIEFNKHEIELQRKEICLEIDNLETYIERILDTLKAVDANALEIVQKCLILREHRIGIDLCHDNVETQLRKEIDVIEGVRKLLKRTLEQANEQIRRLRSTIYFVDRDLEDKGNVLKIDSHNLTLRETDLNLSMYHGFAPLDPSYITGEEWQLFTTINIETSAKEINNGRQLRSYVDTLLGQVIDDLTNQYHLVNETMRQRIEELKITKSKLETQHSEITRQINEMRLNITKLEVTIAEKGGFLALAHTRLGNRVQRVGIELCKDAVESSLVNECKELRENLQALQQMMVEAQASMRYLLKTQLQLEEDINIKANSIKIDEVDCMTLRQSIDYHSY